ncbi:MAG: DUF4424 family protein [Anaerolineaceae bacterium]|nr:DUF4424 family protein [Anaerolineaceae bacterium]
MALKNNFYKAAFITTIIIGYLLFCTHSHKVNADAAPEPGAVGSTLFPNLNQTKVRMEAETVLMAIPEHSDYWSGHAIVTTTFYMRNMGNETEEMKVRFPMNMAEYDLGYEVSNGEDYCQPISSYPSLEDLSVKINDEEPNIVTKTTTYNNQLSTQGESVAAIINCWAYFDVSFPPGEQVIIEVQYKVYGYKTDDSFVRYKYILQTGEGWYDTIGSADVVIKLPYELDETIIRNCQPDDCVIDENTVSWHYEDFEPDENIEINMIEPSIWSRVVRETLNIQSNAADGEAWGRLGMAYKELITDRHGFISANEYPHFFDKSVNAYQNAIYLLPDDLDWHLGYTDIVCPYAVDAFLSEQEDAQKYAQICGIEIDTLLILRPNDPNIIEYLKFLYNTYPAFFVEYGFNIFAGKMHMPTLAPVPTKSAATLTSTISITSTPINMPPATQTPTANISSESSIPPTVNPFGNVQPQPPFVDDSISRNQTWFSFFGNIVLLLLVFIFYFLKQRKK